MLLYGGYSWTWTFVRVCYSEYVSSFGMLFAFFSKRRNIEVLALDGNRGMNISGLFVGMDKLRNLTLKFCYINTVFKFNSPTLLSSVQIQELITFTLPQLESCFFAYAVRVWNNVVVVVCVDYDCLNSSVRSASLSVCFHSLSSVMVIQIIN